MLTLPRLGAIAGLPPPTGRSKSLCKASVFSSFRPCRRRPAPPFHLGAPSRRIIFFSVGSAEEKQVPTAVEAEVVGEEEIGRTEGLDAEVEEWEEEEGGGGKRGGFSYSDGFRRRGKGTDYDRDPEFAEILGSCFDDPQKAQSRVEERIRKKRNKILQAKTGSAKPMKVTFNKFDFSNSYIWLEFYNAPLANDISLICDTIRSWHIIGRLGGCNSLNMQLSQLPLDHKRPTYDAVQGANATPTTFYNIGDLELQDNLGRIWVDVGTTEPLLLDVLANALTQINSDYVGIKQVVFGASEFENWKENFTSEDAGCSVHKI
ncbi:hypothetical protein Taro_024606 [Colocasia esculenta]|uniref:Uncharacterized protein n=1 Tax=Colocasia esculenta TaxID=4460 RepID=A0A843V7X9_COLES|nr:hypothetical protein [Colocasia esculenta]